jgi:hypothetical protein
MSVPELSQNLQQWYLKMNRCRRKLRRRMKVLQAMQAGGWYVPW